jgi:hypothetical protein
LHHHTSYFASKLIDDKNEFNQQTIRKNRSFISKNMSYLSQCKSTILITGGATGIGLAFAQRLMALGHVVIAAGRRQNILDEAREANPGLRTIQGDISSDSERLNLFQKVIKEYPEVNVLINNAGIISLGLPLASTTAEHWESHKSVLAINLEGTIHMSILFLPYLVKKPNALIVNVTSVAGYFAFHSAPVYSAAEGSSPILSASYTCINCVMHSCHPLLHDLSSPPTQRHLCAGGGDPAALCRHGHVPRGALRGHRRRGLSGRHYGAAAGRFERL